MTEQNGRAAVRLAQANQRLEQESAIFARKLERDRQLSRLQTSMGWTVLVMLPTIAVVCVVIFFNQESLRGEIVTAASAAFFLDVLGTVMAGYKAFLPTKPPEELLTAVTRDPYEDDRGEEIPGEPAPTPHSALEATPPGGGEGRPSDSLAPYRPEAGERELSGPSASPQAP